MPPPPNSGSICSPWSKVESALSRSRHCWWLFSSAAAHWSGHLSCIAVQIMLEVPGERS